MYTFILGVLAGSVAVSIIAMLVFINGKSRTILATLQVIAAKLNQIDRTTISTMQAAETFVDVLNQSAEGMMFGPTDTGSSPRGNPKDDFRDLRETFEDGIRNLEEEPESDDEDNWKKGT